MFLPEEMEYRHELEDQYFDFFIKYQILNSENLSVSYHLEKLKELLTYEERSFYIALEYGTESNKKENIKGQLYKIRNKYITLAGGDHVRIYYTININDDWKIKSINF